MKGGGIAAGAILRRLTVAAGVWVCGASLLAASSEARAPGGRYVVGLSPFLDRDAKDAVYRELVRLAIRDLPLDASLWVFDAYHLGTVARLDVPKVRAFESERTRVNQFRGELETVRRFLAEVHPPPEAGGVDFSGAIRLPQFVRFVGEHLLDRERSNVVILLGSPLYLDEKEPSYSMVDGYFPSDGHLLATQEGSVFGVGDAAGMLEGVTVHFGYVGDPWMSTLQEERVGRFWGLLLQLQGARLASFTRDLPTVFHAVRCGSASGAGAMPTFDLDRHQTKIEMVRVTREVASTDWITRDRAGAEPSPAPTTTRGPMKIGIRWAGAVDLDLYARPTREGETLFFQHSRSAAGYYYKDHRSSPDREFEFIEFEVPVEVHEVEAAINFYDGRATPGPTGEVRVEFEGRIYSREFSIEGTQGNRGRGGAGQETCWTTLDLPGLLGLR